VTFTINARGYSRKQKSNFQKEVGFMAQKEIRGVVAILTKYAPCDEDGAFDERSFRNHIRWLLKKGIHIMAFNSGADFDYNDAERRRFAEIILEEVKGRVPTIIGASAWDTETAVKRAKEMEKIGADVVFLTGPPLTRPLGTNPQKNIVEHFKRVSDAIHTPMAFYNTPGGWPGIMPPETLRMIEHAAPNVLYMKAGEREMAEYMKTVDGLAGSRIRIIAGKSYYNFHQLHYAWDKPARPVGMSGYLTAVLPAEHVQMWQAFEEGNIDRAREIWYAKILPVAILVYGREFGYNESTHPNEILKQMGIIQTHRIPFSLAGPDDYTKKEIAKYLQQMKPDIS
jgi:4-hydroxy-tetrahydrodipicolinate synthase